MTVSYTSDIANGRKFVSFWRVMLRWRGSLYKLIWRDLLCYCALFALFYVIQVYYLPTHMRTPLQKIQGYVSSNIATFPVPFILSFFVNQVADRWWKQYQTVPSPDTLGLFVNAAIPGKDEESRMIRRTIVRYSLLSLILTLRTISTRVKKRFPTIKHVEEAGLILEEENVHNNRLETQFVANNWLPLVWATNIATHAQSLKKVTSDQCLRLVITELTAHRDKLGTLVGFDLVNIPLVYTQTVVVMVVSYLGLTLFSYQPTGNQVDYIYIIGFTITTITNFTIYLGLLKVATVMLNPFGEDDDDFELNGSIDRHIKAAYMIVDEMHEVEPEMVKDAYWDEVVPKSLPYTVGSASYRKLDPNCFEKETRQTTKKIKTKIRRTTSSKGLDGTVSQSKEIKNNKTHFYNKHLKKNIDDSNYIHSDDFLNRALNYLPDDLIEDEFPVYDIPETTRPISEVQRPSTSKECLN